MKKINKFYRIIVVVCLVLCEILLAMLYWLLLLCILFIFKADALYNAMLSNGFYIYIVLASLVIIRNTYHRVKWYVRTNPISMQCTRCHTRVSLVRYNEGYYLDSPISVCIPRINQFCKFVGYKVLLYKTIYRPYLQLECPNCGEKQVVCPHCHEAIPLDQVVCKYDKPSVCPHCGKRIYTPVPMREWEGGIYIGDILD